jgi:tRNA pseudouridine38-40 synthase
VAGVVTEALTRVTRTAADRLGLVVAGRTDAGVHARGQVCHLDLPVAAWVRLPGRATYLPREALARRLRGVLPCDVRVRCVRVVPPEFDARFAALRRRYAYRVCDDPAGRPPLRRRDVVAHRRRLDLLAMEVASRTLIGLHDFAAYCRRREGATTVRTLLEYSWYRDPSGFVTARVVADAFCHSMVRTLVGAVLAVGDGRRPVGWPAQVLAARVRDPGVTVAPARGLALEEVVYPDDAGLAKRVAQARSVRHVVTGRPSE